MRVIRVYLVGASDVVLMAYRGLHDASLHFTSLHLSPDNFHHGLQQT